MKNFTKMLTDNKTTSIIVSMLIVLYSVLAAPALPNSVILFFDTWYGKLLFMFLIAFVASHNVQVALVVSILFLIILNMATKLEVENFKQEHFTENKTSEKSPDLSTETTEQLKKILCNMAKEDKTVDMKMNIRDYASKNMDKITKRLNIDDKALNAMLENMPNKSIEELCVEKFENDLETETFQNEEDNETFNNDVLVVNPADPMDEVGAPVDF